MIADFFGCSIDKLFGRTMGDYGDIETQVSKFVGLPLDKFFQEADLENLAEANVPEHLSDEAMDRAFKICLAVLKGLYSTRFLEIIGFSPEQMMSNPGMPVFAKMINNTGMALVSMSKSAPYFLLMPEPACGRLPGLYELDEYIKAFTDLANPDILKSLFLIHSQDLSKKFSAEYFGKMAELNPEIAAKTLKKLVEMGFIEESVLELDDKQIDFYNFKPRFAFPVLLTVMLQYIRAPVHSMDFVTRDKPFLTKN